MEDTKYSPYDKLPKDHKMMLMGHAAHWLSLKPELIGEVKNDKELIDRLASFAKVLHEYFPQGKSSIDAVPLHH
jgi:hypothetical protein